MTLEHRLGHYYIQDAASMLAVELFGLDGLKSAGARPGSSPGGKTAHLSGKLRTTVSDRQ
jgi:16S rRNA (cytosine1407-C5)-methyltransferase